MSETYTPIALAAAFAFLLGAVLAWLVRGIRLRDLERALAECREANQEREKKMTSAQRELSDARGRLLALQSDVDARDRVLVEVKRQLTDCGAAESRCREELARLRSQLETPVQQQLEDSASDLTVAGTLPQVKPPSTDPPPRQFDLRPAQVDDLQTIKGIGPGLEKQLNHLGIYQFRQIARWSEADIDYFDAQLERFRGRIRRDRWVERARECHEARYGQSP